MQKPLDLRADSGDEVKEARCALRNVGPPAYRLAEFVLLGTTGTSSSELVSGFLDEIPGCPQCRLQLVDLLQRRLELGGHVPQ